MKCETTSFLEKTTRCSGQNTNSESQSALISDILCMNAAEKLSDLNNDDASNKSEDAYSNYQFNLSETTQRNPTRHNTTQNKTIQYNSPQRNATQRNTTQNNTIKYNSMQRNATQHNTKQYNTIQCNAIQCITVQYNTID